MCRWSCSSKSWLAGELEVELKGELESWKAGELETRGRAGASACVGGAAGTRSGMGLELELKRKLEAYRAEAAAELQCNNWSKSTLRILHGASGRSHFVSRTESVISPRSAGMLFEASLARKMCTAHRREATLCREPRSHFALRTEVRDPTQVGSP